MENPLIEIKIDKKAVKTYIIIDQGIGHDNADEVTEIY